MQLDLTWTGIGVIIAILAHAFYTVRWASKVEYRLTSIADGFIKLDKELEKRDSKIDAAWRQIDVLRERVIRIEASNGNNKEGKHE